MGQLLTGCLWLSDKVPIVRLIYDIGVRSKQIEGQAIGSQLER